jgi:hypothetical protein
MGLPWRRQLRASRSGVEHIAVGRHSHQWSSMKPPAPPRAFRVAAPDLKRRPPRAAAGHLQELMMLRSPQADSWPPSSDLPLPDLGRENADLIYPLGLSSFTIWMCFLYWWHGSEPWVFLFTFVGDHDGAQQDRELVETAVTFANRWARFLEKSRQIREDIVRWEAQGYGLIYSSNQINIFRISIP